MSTSYPYCKHWNTKLNMAINELSRDSYSYRFTIYYQLKFDIKTKTKLIKQNSDPKNLILLLLMIVTLTLILSYQLNLTISI